MNLTFVSDFDLIRASYGDADILTRPWMAPANRDVCNRLFKVLRAEEEIARLNTEVTRLRTSMYYETIVWRQAVQALHDRGMDNLAREISHRLNMRLAVNHRHHLVLNRIEGLDGFTGRKGKGVPKGWTEEMINAVSEVLDTPDGESDAEGVAELEREDARDDVCRLSSVMEDLRVD